MFDDSTKVVDTTQVKSAGKTLALVLALCVASYLPGRWVIEQCGHGVDWAKLTARLGLAEIVAWDMGHFDYGLDHKAKRAGVEDSYSLAELQSILYRVTVRNQNLEYALEDVKEQTHSMQIALNVDGITSRPVKNN